MGFQLHSNYHSQSQELDNTIKRKIYQKWARQNAFARLTGPLLNLTRDLQLNFLRFFNIRCLMSAVEVLKEKITSQTYV